MISNYSFLINLSKDFPLHIFKKFYVFVMYKTTRLDLHQGKSGQIRARTKVFENYFFPCCIKEWLKLGDEIRSIESSKQFKKTILDFIRSKENSIYAMHNILGLKLLTRLRLNFSHLSEHKL